MKISYRPDNNPRLLGKPYVLPRSISECRAFGANYSRYEYRTVCGSGLVDISSMMTWVAVTDFVRASIAAVAFL